MAIKTILLFILLQIIGMDLVMSQHNPYSLEPAVDALHRHEQTQAQKLLLKEYENPRYTNTNADEYYNDAKLWKQYQLNKLLAKYLEKEDANENMEYGQEFDDDNDDDYLLNEQKRRAYIKSAESPYKHKSIFREIDNNYQQQQLQQQPIMAPETADLTMEFLKEIDRERNLEREEKYKENLGRLWSKYQQQEAEIESELFANEQQQQQQQQQHQQLQQDEDEVVHSPHSHHTKSTYRKSTPTDMLPYYMTPVMEKRRLVLPWLPASRKKRFPVSKRSPASTLKSDDKFDNRRVTSELNDGISSHSVEDSGASGTNEKVAKDLQAIFSDTNSENIQSKNINKNPSITATKKITPQPPIPAATLSPLMHTAAVPTTNKLHKIEKKSQYSKPEMYNDDGNENDEDSDEDDVHYHLPGGHDHEHDHDADHDHHHNEDVYDDSDDDDDDDDDERKKKRAAIDVKKRSNPEVFKEDQIIPGDLTDIKRKKSIQWSKYFGIDRKKKSNALDWALDDHETINKLNGNEQHHYELNEEKLENMDKKLKTIEDLIIDQAVKYTGAHEGITNPEDIQRLKDHVVSKLAQAYSLEKMRRGLDKMIQSIDAERHLKNNEIENDAKAKEAAEKEKRVAIKKEKAEFDNNNHQVEASTEKVAHLILENGLNEDDKKKKMKRNNKNMKNFQDPYELNDFENELGHVSGQFEPMNEGFMGGANNGGKHLSSLSSPSSSSSSSPLLSSSSSSVNNNNQCPILDLMEKRCRGVDLLSGDIHQNLLPICELHQLCYVCGTSQTSCDFQYLSEADLMCGHNKECQSAARSALMILRGSPGPQLGPRECIKNPCLYRVLRNIGF